MKRFQVPPLQPTEITSGLIEVSMWSVFILPGLLNQL